MAPFPLQGALDGQEMASPPKENLEHAFTLTRDGD